MEKSFYVQTERVGLRRFQDSDLDSFFQLNSDPQVMEFLPKLLSRDECADYMRRINNKIDEQGFGFWAAENLVESELMGFVGITRVSFEADFVPAVEIGWRLARRWWGQGFATEAAIGVLDFAFQEARLSEVVSFTAMQNEKSFRVMERIGMTRERQFEHPLLEAGHRLRSHWLYRISKAQHQRR